MISAIITQASYPRLFLRREHSQKAIGVIVSYQKQDFGRQDYEAANL